MNGILYNNPINCILHHPFALKLTLVSGFNCATFNCYWFKRNHSFWFFDFFVRKCEAYFFSKKIEHFSFMFIVEHFCRKDVDNVVLTAQVISGTRVSAVY